MKAEELKNKISNLLLALISTNQGVVNAIKDIELHQDKLVVFLKKDRSCCADEINSFIKLSLNDIKFLCNQIYPVLNIIRELEIKNPAKTKVCDSIQIGFELSNDIQYGEEINNDFTKCFLPTEYEDILFKYGLFYMFCHELAHIYLHVKDASHYRGYTCQVKKEIAADKKAFEWINVSMDNTYLDVYKAIGVLCGLSVNFQGDENKEQAIIKDHPHAEYRIEEWIKVSKYGDKELLKKAYNILYTEARKQITNDEYEQ